jgi:hypothetical protein
LLQLSVAIGGAEDGMPVFEDQRSKTMFVQSYSQDRLACAFGALVFAGLSIASALFPLIQA